jgi:outer membrane protein OmpA-like peptidoglycan-associated protein
MKKISIIRAVILLFFIIGFTTNAELYAMTVKSTTKQQNAILNKANLAYENFKFSLASNYYENYLQIGDTKNKAVLTKLADSYWQIGKFDSSLRVYKLLFSAPASATKQLQLRIAELYSRYSDYGHAAQWLDGVEGYGAKADVFNSADKMGLMKKDSLNWEIKLLNVNTRDQEFSPCLADSLLYFSSNRDTGLRKKYKVGSMLNYSRLWEIPVTKLRANTGGNKTSEVTLAGGFTEIGYNTAPLSVDKNKHFYFSANQRKADKLGVNRLCIMEMYNDSKGAFKTNVLPLGDPKSYTVMHPTINPEGTLLVFACNKTGGVGGYDLYFVQRKGIKQAWSEPKILTNSVNTAGNEVFPVITNDGYLYYSSDAAPGLGGLDIFRLSLEDALSGTTIPEHLSYPINSSADDFGWTQGATNSTGYFTSDRAGSNDIYSYAYSYKDPEIKKIVKVEEPPKPVIVEPVIDDKYLFSVFFDYSKRHINSTNNHLLEALLNVMKKNPCLKIQLKAFTDLDGGSYHNLKLSKKRAMVVRKYLVNEGIDASRLETLYFGETQQLNENSNVVEKTVNRRVIFQPASTGCVLDVNKLLLDELIAQNSNHSDKITIMEENGKYVVAFNTSMPNVNASSLEQEMKSILPGNGYTFEEKAVNQIRILCSKSLIEANAIAAIVEAIGILDK